VSVGFGDDFKEQVRAATSIHDLVSETVNLIQNGRDYKGLCPFHEDNNPSFNVYPDRQTYRCWVCDKGGDCFTWVQETQATTFPEALEILAERANIEIPKRSQSEFAKKSQDSKVTQYEIVEWAISLMQQALRMGEAGELARGYAKERNLSEETQRKFRLGYHPESWSWLLDKAKGRYTEKQLLSVGLVGERNNGRGYYDNLVGRFVFPIIDERGRPVAFGGRVLPGSNIESPAKYWNSPESNIFLKRKTLYAFEQARDTIRTSKSAIIVEGYMDCIACHQAGVTNAVATLGTALTEDHVKFLKRFAERVVLIYDGDQAGMDAAERSIGRFLAQDLDLRVLTLKEGQDPSDYLETHGKDEFEDLIGTAPEAWEYKLQTVTDRYGIDSVSGRQQVMNQLMELMAAAPGLEGTLREDLILRKVCQRVSADETTVRRQLKELRSKKTTRPFIRQDQPARPEPVNVKFNGVDLAERELLEVILSCPDYTDYIRHQIGSDDFNNMQHRQLLELCFDLVTEEGILPDAQSVIAAAESDSAILSLVNALLDTASEKGISELMREQPLTDETGGTSVPPHLERVLGPILLRRAKNQNMLSKQKLAQADSSSSKLNNDTMDALRRIFSFRQSQMGDDPPSLK
jgi:DNA primase